MEVKYLNFSEDSKLDTTFLCKYIPLERALQAVIDNKLWFSNPEKWLDPYESFFLNNSFDDHDCVLKNRVWVTCFTTRGRSEAQWKAYTENDLALMLELDGQSLLNQLSEIMQKDATIYVGKVQYVPTRRFKESRCCDILGVTQSDLQGMPEEELSVRLMLLKRLAFQYENEIRVFLIFHNQLDKPNVDGGFVNGIFDNGIIKRITICPNARGHTREMLQNYLKEKGYKVTCHHLYDDVINKVIELP